MGTMTEEQLAGVWAAYFALRAVESPTATMLAAAGELRQLARENADRGKLAPPRHLQLVHAEEAI